MQEYSPKRRTALVFTGSGTSGAYHAGVLKALDESGVKIDLVVGSGVGRDRGRLRRGGRAARSSTARAASGTASRWRLVLPPPARPLRLGAGSARRPSFGVFLLPARRWPSSPALLFPARPDRRPRGPGLARRASLGRLWVAPEALSGALPRRARHARVRLRAGWPHRRRAPRAAARPPAARASTFESLLDARPAPHRLRRGALGDRARPGRRHRRPPSEGELGKRYVALAGREPRPARLPRADPAHRRPGDGRRAARSSLLGDERPRGLRRGPGPRAAARSTGLPGAVDLRAPGLRRRCSSTRW